MFRVCYTMAKLTEVMEELPARKPTPQRRRRTKLPRQQERKGGEYVEQIPISADEYLKSNGNGTDTVMEGGRIVVERQIRVPVEVPVLPVGDPRNPYIASTLARVTEMLHMLGESGSDMLGRDVYDGPVPSEHGIAAAIRRFKLASQWEEGDRALVWLAASVIAFAARRRQDRLRNYDEE